MAFCSKCGTQVNDGTRFCPKCGQAINGAQQSVQGYQQSVQGYQQSVQGYQQPVQGYQQQFHAYQQPQQRPIQPSSNMVLAILTTIFCCLPTGIYAIIQASKVDKLYMSGDYDEATKASSEAKKWSIIGIVLAVVGWILYFIFGGMAFLAAIAAGAE